MPEDEGLEYVPAGEIRAIADRVGELTGHKLRVFSIVVVDEEWRPGMLSILLPPDGGEIQMTPSQIVEYLSIVLKQVKDDIPEADERFDRGRMKVQGDAMEGLDMAVVDVAAPGFGQQVGKMPLSIHGPDRCRGSFCPFHNPSHHPLWNAPMNVRMDRAALVERMCEHGVGHPDPDSLAYLQGRGVRDDGTHGCDGCCREEVVG